MVSMVMRLRAGRSEVGFQAGERVYLYSRNAQAGSGANPASYSVGNERFFPRHRTCAA